MKKLKDLKNNQCRNCLQIKTDQDFRHNRRTCKSCESIYKKTRYYKDPIKEIARTQKWNEANPERYKFNKQTFEQKHPKRRQVWMKKNPEKVAQYVANWQKKNPHKCNALNAKYRATKLKQTPSWLKEDDFRFILLFYQEAERLTKQTGIKYEVDHIIPLRGKNVSGLHVPWNLQVIPKFENCQKSNNLIL